MRRAGWVLLALLAAPAAGQEPAPLSGYATRSDTSPPLRDLIDRRPAAPTGLSIEVPIGTRPPLPPDLMRPPSVDASPVAPPAAPGSTLTPAVNLSFEGLSDDDNAATVGSRFVPPDTNGDIGFDHLGNKIYIQWVNVIWAIYDTSGNLLSGPTAGSSFWSGFGGSCETTNHGDPLVLYDDDAERWVFAQFVVGAGLVCVAVSTSSDPLGAYHRYSFQVASGAGTADYPKLGVWAQGPQGGAPASANQSAYTLTSRNFPFDPDAFMRTIVFERDAMLAGAAAQFASFPHGCAGDDCVEGQLPPHQAGPPPAFGTCPTFFTIVDEGYDGSPHGSDGVRLHRACVDWQNAASLTITETFAPSAAGFDRLLGNGFSSCITPMPASGPALDCLANFTMYRAQYRFFDDAVGTHASVVLNTTVDAGLDRGGIHWMELRSDDGQTDWEIFQEGTFAPDDGKERWMGSIAQSGERDIALGFSRVSGTELPSLYYTMRESGDTAGSMGTEELCHVGTGVQQSSSRWGDYSSMSVDPKDDCTFWFTSEYYEVTGSFDFNTRICSFKPPGCGEPLVEITMPADGAEFDDTTAILFEGTATDPEDGDLTSSLAWTSSIAGPIGSGGSFSFMLSPGAHTITASVTDSDGNPASDQIALTITSASCPPTKSVGPGDISTPQTHRAVDSIGVVASTTVTGAGELYLLAGQSVSLANDVSFAAGAVAEIVISADPCTPAPP